MVTLDKTLGDRKDELLSYFRNRAAESLQKIERIYGEAQIRERASSINIAVKEAKDNLVKTLTQKASKEGWNNEEILRCVLMITYVSYVVMIDSRNEIWPYDFMSFLVALANCGSLSASCVLKTL